MSASTALRWRLSPHETTLRLIVDRRVTAAQRETNYLRAAGHHVRDITEFLDRDVDTILDKLAALDSAEASR